MVVGLISRSIVSDDRTSLSQMTFQTSFDRGWNWKVHHLVNVSDEVRELLGEEVLALVGGRVKKMGEENTYRAENPGDAVRKYILECLRARDGVGDQKVEEIVEVIVEEVKVRALAEFQVLKPDGSPQGYYQASIMIRAGLD